MRRSKKVLTKFALHFFVDLEKDFQLHATQPTSSLNHVNQLPNISLSHANQLPNISLTHAKSASNISLTHANQLPNISLSYANQLPTSASHTQSASEHQTHTSK
jgi:hypothetical protein